MIQSGALILPAQASSRLDSAATKLATFPTTHLPAQRPQSARAAQRLQHIQPKVDQDLRGFDRR